MKIILKRILALSFLFWFADLNAAMFNYTVEPHDTLWGIAANQYHNPLKWPDIYQANKDKINDPNLIYPRQQFALYKSLKKLDAWYLALGVGITNLANFNDYHTATAEPFAGTDTYRYKSNNPQMNFAVGLGYRWQFNSRRWFSSYALGLDYRYYFQNKYAGYYQFVEPEYTTGFNFTTQSQSLMLVGRLALLTWHNFSPYIKAGLGLANNIFKNYQDASDIIWLGQEHTFANNRSVNFSYLGEAGLSYQLNQNLQLNVYYQYTDLGKLHSGENQNGKTIPIDLKTQSAGFEINYYFV